MRSYIKKYAETFSPMAFAVLQKTVIAVIVLISQATKIHEVKIHSLFNMLIHKAVITDILNNDADHVSRPFDIRDIPL